MRVESSTSPVLRAFCGLLQGNRRAREHPCDANLFGGELGYRVIVRLDLHRNKAPEARVRQDTEQFNPIGRFSAAFWRRHRGLDMRAMGERRALSDLII